MSALAGALGSVIGYLGAEVAEETLFERILWPQRIYNDFDFWTCIKMTAFMLMGGPLHAAALRTLDTFRDNGLYLGRRRGNMLGTAFLRDIGVRNFCRTNKREKDVAKESRNAF